jgi:hypothetical protein
MSGWGALAGLGKAISDEADVIERRNLALDRQAATADLAAQKAAATQELEREKARLRAEAAGSGTGSGGKGINLFQMAQAADTPEKQQRFTETVRAFGGDDAANVVGRIYGRPGPMVEVNPTAGDFARFDRTVDENGQSQQAAPATMLQAAQADAEKGRVALQRLMTLAMDPAKLDDHAKGEGQFMVNDMVRNAGSDANVRKAGAAAMALGGKDRMGVQGDQVVDKAGVEGAKQTDLGNAKAQDERASASKHAADANKVRTNPVTDDELKTLQQLRLTAEKRLADARKALTEFDKAGANLSTAARKERAAERDQLQREVTAARGEFDTISTRLTARLDRKDNGSSKPQAAEAPLPLPKDKASLRSGKVYSTGRGPARWNGTAFEAL